MAGLKLTEIFLKTKEELIGTSIYFTIKDVEFKDNEAVVVLNEIPTMQIKISSKIKTKSFSRRKRN